ncbi:MAG: MerR family transcriptional regulator [Anaerolineales bacterium]|nr:MerR family transcriptional regulator [Anaerolineales bacterium]
MVTAIRLNEYSTAPLYNIKAVVQSTSISPSTLRAWERRYNMCKPQRSESGYRLYSDRDVAVIRWLKAQVDAGMSISQAVSWLQSLTDQAAPDEQTTLPDPTGRAVETPAPTALSRLELEDFSRFQERVLLGLLNYNEDGAESALAHAFTLYPVEHVGEHIIMPVLVEIGERWHRGELSITREHYATNYLMQRLAAILRTVPNATVRPIIWVGCAPGELHEIGDVAFDLLAPRRVYCALSGTEPAYG